MNKLVFPFLLVFVDSQNLLWSTNVTLNNYNWFPWDVEAGLLMFYSGGREYKCNTFLRTCEEFTVSYRPNAYCVESYDYYYYTDDKSGRVCRTIATSGTRCELFSPAKIAREFESIVVNGDYLYYGYPDSLGTFTSFEWTKGSLYKNKVKLIGTRYQMKDTLYSFIINGTDTRVMKYSIDGLKIMWTQSLSLCRPSYTDRELFVTAWQPFVYVICSSSNLLYKFDSEKGLLLDQVQLDIGDVKFIHSSFEYVFILYGDATILQYTRDFNYVNTYRIENTKTLPN
jgi:hypothetical protein